MVVFSIQSSVFAIAYSVIYFSARRFKGLQPLEGLLDAGCWMLDV